MSFVRCERCGHDNEFMAPACELCGAALGLPAPAGGLAHAPDGHAYATPARAYPVGEVPAGKLPLDFAVRPFESVGAVLGPTFQLYREHLGAVARIVLVAVPAQVAFEYFATQPGDEAGLPCLLFWLATKSVSALVTGALAHTVMSLLRTGESPPLTESLAWGLRKWWPLMLCTLLSSLLIGMGTMLLCVPGVILSVIYAVALPAAAVEKIDPIKALERSANLTKGYRGMVFVTTIASWLLVYGSTYLNAMFGTPLRGEGVYLLTSLVTATATQLIASMGTTISLFTYLSLRADRGEFDAPAPPAGQLP